MKVQNGLIEEGDERGYSSVEPLVSAAVQSVIVIGMSNRGA